MTTVDTGTGNLFRSYGGHMLFQDIRFGFRTALKNKGVTGLAVVCLAIGIGLNTMMFSVTDGVLIHPLPYRDPDTIVVIHSTQKESGDNHDSLCGSSCRTGRSGRGRSASSPARSTGASPSA